MGHLLTKLCKQTRAGFAARLHELHHANLRAEGSPEGGVARLLAGPGLLPEHSSGNTLWEMERWTLSLGGGHTAHPAQHVCEIRLPQWDPDLCSNLLAPHLPEAQGDGKRPRMTAVDYGPKK